MGEHAPGLQIIRMDGAFGACVEGVDLSTPLNPHQFGCIARALQDHHVLALPNQTLTPQAFAAFARLWGAPIDFFDLDYCLDGNPNILLIDNREDCPAYKRDNALHWHVDSTYESPPVAVTMLYGVESPTQGNETLFADMVAAYAALPAATKALIDGLIVEHGMGDPRLSLAGEKRGPGGDDPPVQIRPTVRHPLVMRHPQSGEKVLYAPSGSPFGIVGMPTDEAIAVLRGLKEHAVQPQFIQSASASAGTVLIWDNYAVMHSATPTRYSNKDGERRVVYGIRTRETVDLAEARANEGAAQCTST